MKKRVENFFDQITFNGRVFIKGEDMPYTGKLICKYSNDILKEEADYIDGIKNGIDKKYYPNGYLKESIEYRYSNNILPIPCDQRYCINDMRRIIDIIQKD